MAPTIGRVPGHARLADEHAIREIIHMHCRGVDRADEAALKICYWPEASVLYGAEPAPAHPFCEDLVPALKGFAQTHHLVSNILVTFPDEDHPVTAKVESYLIAFHYLANPDGEDSEMTYLGRYFDQFEKRGDLWKIIQRTPVMSWSQNAATTHDDQHPALAALTKAGRFPEDIVYR
ncbi:nuclear transport factor 2 family protein [Parasphingorhabdus sp.]|uniref:nuclear transport factor 2 family protein n=1 Tax=Parasphingorhabdus sp. TaxID=2709688 RepID=UPI0030037B64